MTWNPRLDPFKVHFESISEAADFISDSDSADAINYFNSQDTSCAIHDHVHHTPNNDRTADFFSWDPECFLLNGRPNSDYDITKYDNIFGISYLLQRMKDAAIRHINEPLVLAKVVFHKYIAGASGPEHTDVWPVASLLYFNDDYDGGELYFPNQNVEISPQKNSLYIFEGGGDNRHGVKRISNGNRYVLVAFWEYEDKTNLQEFWERENLSIGQNNAEMEERQRRYRSYSDTTNVLYLHRFPVLEIGQFVTNEDADLLSKFLRANDDIEDECWAPVCFREYWTALGMNPETLPTKVGDMDENYLKQLNSRIKEAVEFFLESDDIEFSKFKGHLHKQGAISPPHSHGPAVAIAILTLNSDYDGGEITIPKYNISFKTEPCSLYIFREGPEINHGVSLVVYGDRETLVSHWQPKGHEYNLAGAPERKEYVV
jgi:hypothetical protein